MTSMIVETANAQHVAAVVIADVMTPPPAVDYLAWAEANIVFSERESPFPGPYNRTLFPYFDEILRALGPADPCRIVTLKKSAQLGGTVLANIFVGGSMAMDPGDVLYVHPTESNAQRWSKMKLAPMLKGTSALAKLGAEWDVIPIPAEIELAAQEARETLIEKDAEIDDDLMARYLEGDTNFSPEEILRAVRVGCLSHRMVPVLCGSAFKN